MRNLTVQQVARMAGCSRATVRKAISTGDLVAVREGLVPMRDAPSAARAGLAPRAYRWKIALQDARNWSAQYRSGAAWEC